MSEGTKINWDRSNCKCAYCVAQQWRLKVAAEQLVLIQRCSDPHMWYADRVGQLVPVERVSRDGLWAREPAGYINIIKFEDVAP